MYIEILKAPSNLSLCLQKSDCDIVYGLKQILKVLDSIKCLRRLDPSLWPTVKLVMERVDSKGSVDCYQGAEIRNYTDTMLESCKRQALGDLESLSRSIQQRLEWSDLHFLRALIVFLESQSWVERECQPTDHGQDVSLEEVKHAVELLSAHFRDPLEASSVIIPSL